MSTTLTSGIDPASFSSVISPAQDLFRYVNGPWIDTYRLPDDRSRYGSFDKLAEDAERQIREILDDENAPAPLSRLIYRTFLNTQAIEAAGLEPIRDDLSRIDQAADKTELVRALATVDGAEFFGIGVYGDPKDPTTDIIHIEQGGLLLPDEAYYRDEHHAAIREAFSTMVARQLRHAGYAEDDESATEQARTLLDIETRIASHHWDVVATRDSQKTYNPYDWQMLTEALQHVNLQAWTQAWQEAYDATETSAAQPVSISQALAHSIVHEPSFLTGFDAFWQAASLDELKLWARVHVIVGWASMLSEPFDSTNFDFYGKILSGAKQQRERWKRAVSLVNGTCGEEVGKVYVQRHFPASSKQRMEELVANLIDAYRVSITTSDWLGEQTKAKALEKLSKFTPKIGYTNHWRDYSALVIHEGDSLIDIMRAANRYEMGRQLAKAGKPVDHEEWLMNPQTVNAYYEPSMNVIVFPAAILQPPFFNPDAEDAANYGGIGAVIGHEIGHGFDDQGSQYDGDGMLHDWWTEEDKANFETRTKALIEQYNAFVPQQLADKYAEHPEQAPHVNGALTIGENIGDLGGVTIALKAYAFSLDKAHGNAKDGSAQGIADALRQAPVMDGYTGVQRFFLNYAAIWRTKNRDELAEQHLQIDPHSPAECRTNGIARNVDLFYDAFHVTADDPMWLDPDQRVHIW